LNKIKISAVSYTNTKPFIYGIEHSPIAGQIDLSLDIPADCASKLISGKVDIGLIPVAEMPQVPNANIVADYCIGSVGAVNSVFIFSSLPADQIRTLKLDSQSRTSNNLARVLLKFHWEREVEFVTDPDASTDAIVLIGDRTFGKKAQYAYAYDMGQEWMNYTGLPFVYAAWVANKVIPESFVSSFNEALRSGLDNRRILLSELPPNPDFDLEDYLLNKLDFELTDKKREALDLFLSYIARL
jgi:chorismate dehydratase